MTARWDCEKGKHREAPEIDAFIEDLVAVCQKHKMSLGHEAHAGAFEVYPQVFPDALEWLRQAHIAEPFRR